MEYTDIGGLRVSRICMGCEALGGTDCGSVDIASLFDAVNAAADCGINFFDTADVYGLGQSEINLSKALGSRRHEVVIATKFGVNWKTEPGSDRAKTFFDSSPEHAVSAIEGSLKRLGLESLPLVYIHWPDPSTPLHETLFALSRQVEAGKIQHIGLSNFSAAQIRLASACQKIAAVQIGYNLINFGQRQDVVECCRELEIPLVTWGTLAQGLLSGKYGADARFEANDRRSRLSHFEPSELERNMATVERVRKIASLRGVECAQVAARWNLDTPGIACAIVGAKNAEQARANAGAADWKLSLDEQNDLAND